jgi:hypothetical protein
MLDDVTKFKGWGEKPITDLTCRRFGRLIVMWFIGRRQFDCGAYETMWQCACDCGNILFVGRNNLNKATKSCGCLNSEISQKSNFKHGQSRRITGLTTEYRSYSHAKARCENITDAKYLDYGARGIEFRFKSFSGFFDCVGKKPTPQHSIDRINNNGHYEAGNVKWSTPKEQVNNRRLKRIENFSNEEIQKECVRRGWTINATV